MPDERFRTCGRRRSFKWNHLEGRKSELTTPARCADCEEDQKCYCIEKSWLDEGKDPKLLKVTNVMVNANPEADKKAEKIAAKAKESLEQIKDKIHEEQLELAEAKADAKA
jgi:hypothetical protein